MPYQIIPYKNTIPTIHEEAYIAHNCNIIGAVRIEKNSSIWFNSVIRGDVDSINIGSSTNIQDGTIIHTSRFNGPVCIGSNVTIGHMALIHACTIHDNAFIGMRATIMDYAVVEEYGFLAAGSLLTPNKVVKTKELWTGSPAKFVRYLNSEDINLMQENVKNYVSLANIYRSL